MLDKEVTVLVFFSSQENFVSNYFVSVRPIGVTSIKYFKNVPVFVTLVEPLQKIVMTFFPRKLLKQFKMCLKKNNRKLFFKRSSSEKELFFNSHPFINLTKLYII